jgi:hypothetical protein
VSTTTRRLEADLNAVTRKLADVSAEVERLRQELAEVKAASDERELLSPSRPLDAPHPAAVMEVTADECDALIDRLDAPANPSEALRKTMAGHLPLPE